MPHSSIYCMYLSLTSITLPPSHCFTMRLQIPWHCFNLSVRVSFTLSESDTLTQFPLLLLIERRPGQQHKTQRWKVEMENSSGKQHCPSSRQHCSPTMVYYPEPRCVLCYTGSTQWCPSRKLKRKHSLSKCSMQLPCDQNRQCRCDGCLSSVWWSSWCRLTDVSLSPSSDTPGAVRYSRRPHTHTDKDKT